MGTGPSPKPADPTSARPVFCPRCKAACGAIAPGTTVVCAQCRAVFTLSGRNDNRPDFVRPSSAEEHTR